MCNLSYSNLNRRQYRTRAGWLLRTVARVRTGGSARRGGSVTMSGRKIHGGTIQAMKVTGFAVVAIAAAIGMSAPAYADPDTDFDNQIAGDGIYGPHDYNPTIAKIVCPRVGQAAAPGA